MKKRIISIAGASLDTGNLGVSALCIATLSGLFGVPDQLEVTLFDEGRGAREARLHTGGRLCQYRLCGEKSSRRLWQRESLWNIRASCRLGGLGNPSARAILDSDAVADISGGDSFTDLYGPRRFRAVTLLKQIVLENRVPLIMLPQTYGPFAAPRNREIARSIVRRSRMAWARDELSFQRLKELLGADFDPRRHCCGVDVAFRLEAMPPTTALPAPVTNWLSDRTLPLIGINVSGLIYNDAAGAAKQYGLKADYPRVIHTLVRRLLEESDARILLIPHVITPPGHYESDVDACAKVAAACGSDGRIAVAPALSDPREVKWVIALLDWFCGTRMHSTIAGLSSGVPTAAIAYSIKTQGVFETCDQGGRVADPRTLDTEAVVEHLIGSWNARAESRRTLQAALPEVLQRASDQMTQIVQACADR